MQQREAKRDSPFKNAQHPNATGLDNVLQAGRMGFALVSKKIDDFLAAVSKNCPSDTTVEMSRRYLGLQPKGDGGWVQ